MTQLQTTREVIAALGGIEAVATITGRDYKSVSGWQTARATFPSSTYLALQRALVEKCAAAPASLWHKMDAAPAKQEGQAA